jgi:hypothetical protein
MSSQVVIDVSDKRKNGNLAGVLMRGIFDFGLHIFLLMQHVTRPYYNS